MDDSKAVDIATNPAYKQFYEDLPKGDTRVAPFTIYTVMRVFVRRKAKSGRPQGQWRRKRDDEACDVADYDSDERWQMVFSVMHPENASKSYWKKVQKVDNPRQLLENVLAKYEQWLAAQA